MKKFLLSLPENMFNAIERQRTIKEMTRNEFVRECIRNQFIDLQVEKELIEYKKEESASKPFNAESENVRELKKQAPIKETEHELITTMEAEEADYPF